MEIVINLANNEWCDVIGTLFKHNINRNAHKMCQVSSLYLLTRVAGAYFDKWWWRSRFTAAALIAIV